MYNGYYCEQHRREHAKQYNRFDRDPDTAKRYGGSWPKIRAAYLSTHPLCAECKAEGRLTPAELVHYKRKNQKPGVPAHAQRRLSSEGWPPPGNIDERKLKGKAVKPSLKLAPKRVYAKNVMADYFSMAMKECEKEVPSAEVLRAEIEDFITARGCDGYVAPQTVTDYVLNRRSFLACECMNRKIGRMTKDLKRSPYVTASAQY